MSHARSYCQPGDVAVVTVDGGKVHAAGFALFEALHLALVIVGRPGVLSEGFDLKVLRGGDDAEIARLVVIAAAYAATYAATGATLRAAPLSGMERGL